MDVTLVIVLADGRSREVPVKRQRTVVGRKPECNIRVPVSSVSREHCEILLEGEKLTIRDLGSSNGTYVNRQRVQEATLGAGDLVGLGPAVFVVKVGGKPDQIDPKDARARGAAPEPMSAAAPPQARPAAPAKAGAKPSGKPASPAPKPVPAKGEDDSGDSSVDFDFDEFLKDDDEDGKL